MPEFLASPLGQDPDASVVAQGLKAQLDSATADQASGLESLRGILAVSQSLFQHEHARLKARLGQDHPRVKALELRIQATPAVALGASAALREVRLKETPAKPDRAVVYGRVLDTKSRGLADVMVSWEDENGRPLKALGEVKTDADGAFAVELAPEALAQLPTRGAFPVLRNASGTLLHREAAPLKPALGGRASLSFTLDRKGSASSSTVVVRPARPAAEGAPPRPKPPVDPWSARGEVRDASGEPVAGLLVTAMDSDVLFDDTLGAGLTGPEGTFSITYGHREFREKEIGPDLYLRLSDAKGREIHRTPIRTNASREEYFAIRLPGTGTGGEPRQPDRPVAGGPERPGAKDEGEAAGPGPGRSSAAKGSGRKKGPPK